MTNHRRRIGQMIAHGVITMIAGFASLAILAWFVGVVLTDRYVWSQWLWWIPAPAALLAAIIGLLCALRPALSKRRRRGRLVVWAGVTALIVIQFCFIEHHFLGGRSASADGLHIVNLNAWHAPNPETSEMIETIAQHRGDLTVVTSPHRVAWDQRVVREAQENLNRVSIGPFTILTTLEIEAIQPLAFTREGISIAMLAVHTDLHVDRPIVVYLMDLPSDPKISRWFIASKVRQYLDEADAPPPDVVLGDFNITRRSASIEHMFPSFHHAYEDAGRGYGATFHRTFPLYHIDHMLLSEYWRATQYELIDPGAGRHMLQSARIVPDKTIGSENQ